MESKLNIDLLRKKKRQLCGESITIPAFNVKDDLAAILSLSLEHKPITPKTILLTKMQAALPYVSADMMPFCEAIIELYLDFGAKNK